MENVFWLVPGISLIALLFAWFFYSQMIKKEEGTPKMIEIANAIREGAISYLKVQDSVVAIFLLVMAGLFSFLAFGLGVQSKCCLLYTSPSPRDRTRSRMPSSA